MVDAIASSPSIDLSGLPPPAVIAQPSFEERLAAKLARALAQWPEFSALLESDPAIKLLEADSYDELVLAQACADAARGVLLAFATGATLDHIAALFDTARLEGESDTAFRQRIQLAPHSFSVAGPELAYTYWARSAHPDVADAKPFSPSPGNVVVTVLSASGDGVPSSAVVDAVASLLAGPVRPLTDAVTVNPVALVNFAISAQLFIFAGPDEALILSTAQDSLAAYLAANRKIGRDVSPSGISAALSVANVHRVELASPSGPIAISDGELAHANAIAVAIGGTES
jgi:phage-related baseplate assembly protein